MTPSNEAEFPFENIDLDRVAIVFDAHKDKEILPWEKHRALPLPPPQSSRVAILVDGLGSSSAGTYVAEITKDLETEGFSTAVYSYGGIVTHFYQPKDTIVTEFTDHVSHLDDYVHYYRQAEDVVLVGYSFGGLVVSEWLYEQQSGVRAIKNFRGSCLVASPIRLSPTRVRYRRELVQLADARLAVDRILVGYKAWPEAVPFIASMVILRCEEDGLLHNHAYTFEDLPPDDRPSVEKTLPYTHVDIMKQPGTRRHILESVTALCEHRYPDFSDLGD